MEIPSTGHGCSLFSTPSKMLVICWTFDGSDSDRYEVISHCGFDLHSPDDYWCLVCGPDCHVIFGKIFTQTLCPFFLGLFVHFLMLTSMSFWILWILRPYQICHLWCFLPFGMLLFHSVENFHHCAKPFLIFYSPICFFCFFALA